MKKLAAVLASIAIFFALFSGAAVPAPAGNFPNPGDPRIIRVEYKETAFYESVGTAFRVGPHYWLTAAHVVTTEDGKQLARVAALKGLAIKTFDVVKVDPKTDTALLYDPEESDYYFRIADKPTSGPVKGIGYPGSIIKPCSVFLSYKTTQATHYAAYKIARADFYDGDIWGGYSGGPAVDSSGKVAGMLVCGDDEDHSGAIPARTLIEFMKGE